MGREVRRVPLNWQHPQNESGKFIPLLPGCYDAKKARYEQGAAWWHAGFYWDYRTNGFAFKDADMTGTYEDWAGPSPECADYMPHWTAQEAIGWQMYEDTTEGTPLSPVMETPEALAHWLVTHKASRWGGETASYEEWMRVIDGGFGGLIMAASPTVWQRIKE